MECVGRLILVVDDEPDVAFAHKDLLEELGCKVEVVLDPEEALQLVQLREFDLVLSDIRMPKMNGMELLSRIKRLKPQTGVVLATVVNDIEHAVRATKLGAYNYLLKPVNENRLHEVLLSYFENTPASLDKDPRFRRIVTVSPLFQDVFHRVRMFAKALDAPVLIEGETGTGKELVAELLHVLSKPTDASFVPVNITALPDEIFESELFGHVKGSFTGAITDKRGLLDAADGGTVFIDEIGELALENQKKLLRVVQSKKFLKVGDTNLHPLKARLIFATNRVLRTEAREGRFREDLYYRLASHTISLPPLRSRIDDIRLLSDYFLRKYSSQYGRVLVGIAEEVYVTLEQYPFPGNVRELEGIISSAVLLELSERLTPESLPQHVVNFNKEGLSLVPGLKGMKEQAIFDALAACDGNQTKAAKQLGIARGTLNRALRKIRETQVNSVKLSGNFSR